MKLHLLVLFLCSSFGTLSAQQSDDCGQLAIEFRGIVLADEGDQLLFEVSNAIYRGNLYAYPCFLLLNEEGDTLAMGETRYYGIGNNFQTHLLEIKSDLSFPLSANLEFYGNYFQNFFCSYPMVIEEVDFVDLKTIEEEAIKVGTNYAGDQIIIDLGGNVGGNESPEYHFNITNEQGVVSYESTLQEDIAIIPVKEVGGSGVYFISVWDAVAQKLLATQYIFVD